MSNPTNYVSVGGDYGTDALAYNDFNYANILICDIHQSDYLKYFRVFLPPGTVDANIQLVDNNGQCAIARHKAQPNSEFGQLIPSNSLTLESYIAADQYAMGYSFDVNNYGYNLTILKEYIPEQLTEANSGWFYVKVDDFKGYTSFSISVSITVNRDTYLNWYQGINWAVDVEGVSVYSGHLTGVSADGTSTDVYVEPAYVPVVETKTFGEEGTSTSVIQLPVVTSAIPPAANLASEFYNLIDLDGNGLIYGYDFKISDDLIEPAFKPLTLRLLEQSPYWLNPINEVTWTNYLLSIGGVWGAVTTLNAQTETTSDAATDETVADETVTPTTTVTAEEPTNYIGSAGTVGNINIPISPFSDN